MILYYTLDENNKPIPCPNTMDYLRWVESHSDKVGPDGCTLRIGLTDINDKVYVSTVYLGLNHGFGDSDPVLWESMVFGHDEDEVQVRYKTHDEAVKGHDKLVKKWKKKLGVK